jgi:VWFA-related protein
VLKEGKLWEKYRYRFDFPAEIKADQLPIVIDRLLRPAEYTSRIKVMDANGGAETIVENVIEVPEIFVAEKIEEAEAAPAPMMAAAQPAAPLPDAAVKVPVVPSLRLVPPPEEIVSGIQTFDTVMEGDGIKGVEFWLDGRKLAVRRSAPFALDIDLGDVPQMRRVRAVAVDAAGKALAGDDIWVNSGTEPFRVRIASPRIAPYVNGLTRVAMDVRVPEDEELESVELYWNERRVATLYDPPFVQTVDIPATDGVGYLRAVATLKDTEAAPVEDVVMINTPAYMEELNVHLVELPTTVLVGGKPASHLTEKDFKVTDDGKPVTLSKFEYVKNLPLSIGMAIDTSGSMQTRMDEAQKAGAQFFQKVLKKGDRAFLLAFDEEPQMVQTWSAKLADMHAGLAKLRAEETTALYDAVIEALYNFQGVRGQKALVLISDGKDTASKFSFDQALEYARRAAVPIYAIGVGIKSNDIDVRSKLQKLCAETGGTVYHIERAADLQKIYDDIQVELRSQYVLGFYPGADIKSGGKWREVEVKTSAGKARTVRGYYP